MRCPGCEQRNSVVAKTCMSCGASLKRKGMPTTTKLAIGGACLLAGSLVYVGGTILPKLADPSENLASVAKRVAAGPKSTDEAQKMKADFSGAIKNLLLKIGGDNSPLIARKLQAVLPDSAFEVHVVDLPKGLKLVEIDTLLQAADFLVMKGTSDLKVFPLTGLEVFDDARTVNDQAGPVIVLLGHSSGQMPHRPQLKTYALLPDFIEDESEKMVPILKGEGSAKFAKNSSDVSIELNLASMAQAEQVRFNHSLSGEFRQNFHWKDARYIPEYRMSGDANAYILMLARALRHPDQLTHLSKIIGVEASRLVLEQGSESLGPLSVNVMSQANQLIFLQINTDSKDFAVTLKRTSDRWTVGSYKVTDKRAKSTSNAPPVAPAKVEPAVPLGINTSPASVAPEKPFKAPPVALPIPKAIIPVVPAVKPVVPVAQVVPTPVSVSGTSGARVSSTMSSPAVRVRSAPKLNARKIGEIPRGSKIQILGREGDWYKIVHNGKNGYVFGEYVDEGDLSAKKDSQQPAPVVVKSVLPVIQKPVVSVAAKPMMPPVVPKSVAPVVVKQSILSVATKPVAPVIVKPVVSPTATKSVAPIVVKQTVIPLGRSVAPMVVKPAAQPVATKPVAPVTVKQPVITKPVSPVAVKQPVTTKPLVSAAVKPVIQPVTTKPVVSTAVKPVTQPVTTKPVVSTAVKPVTQPVTAKPVVSTAVKPVVQPATTKPIVSIAVKPITQPVTAKSVAPVAMKQPVPPATAKPAVTASTAATKPATSSTSSSKPASGPSAVVTRAWSLRDDNHRAVALARVGDHISIVGGLKYHKYKVRLSDGRIGWLDKDAVDLKMDMPEFVP